MNLEDQVVTLLMVNGDELIAYLDHESETDYTLLNPAMTVIANGKLMIKAYSRLSSTDVYIISKKHVIFCNPVLDEYVARYIEFIALSTGESTEPSANSNFIEGPETIN